LEDEETGSANRNAVFIIERNVIIINKNQTIRVEFVAVQIMIRHKISIDSHINDDNIVLNDPLRLEKKEANG
jgi:hypothetical protein